MKIKTTITSTVDKEIPIPYYCKNGLTFIKVTSEVKVIAITTYDFNTSISVTDSDRWSKVLAGDETKQITEQEFNQAYGKALQVLQNVEFQELIANDLYEHQS